MKMNSKILAVAVVAMFVATAFAAVATEDNDAANKTYHLYFEVLDDDGKVVASSWTTFDCEVNNSAWAAKATVAFQSVMEKIVNDVRDYYVTGNEDGVRFHYDSSAYWPACWFVDKGKWTLVEDTATSYTESDTVAVTMYAPDLYGELFYADELPVGADAKKFAYVEQRWGSFWMLLPQTSVTGYDAFGGMLLYIVIAIVIIVIIVGVFVYTKKKNA